MSKNKSGMGKFVLGAAIGAGLGILFAPEKGEVTRQRLQKKLDKMLNKAREIDINDIRLELEEKIEEIKFELEDLDKEKVLKIAKEKGKKLLDKCEELIDCAVEKGTPILEDAAIEVREQTSKVIKDVLTKLENKDEKPKKTKKVSK